MNYSDNCRLQSVRQISLALAILRHFLYTPLPAIGFILLGSTETTD